MNLRADIHNHSCLSPCGDLDASPIALCQTAAARGISVMALTDHNSARNCPAFAEAALRTGIVPLFGTETTSREEVHILSIYPTVSDALDWGNWIYQRLPDYHHDPEKFGDQVVVDVDENILDFEERYLVPAIDASLEEIHAETQRRGGLIIPAHIDRSANSLLSQLGFLPDLAFSALEVTRLPVVADTRGHTLICDSDAHFLEDVAQRSFSFEMDDTAQRVSGAVFTALCAALASNAVELSI